MTLRQVAVDGALLAVECEARPEARGVPLVFLHAGVADRRMWHAQVAAFAPAHRVLAYDRRGFGATCVAQAVPHDRVRDLWAVLDDAGIERALLVGCSQGGRIALDAALAWPQRVLGLALVAPAVGGAPEPGPHSPALQALIDDHAAADAAGDPERLNEIEARVWLDGALGAAGRVQGEARALFLAMNGIALRAGDAGPADEPPPAWPRLHEIKAPALVAWGPLDFPHLQQRCEHLVATLTRARRHVFEGTAHLPNLEQPQAFNAALAGFIGALD